MQVELGFGVMKMATTWLSGGTIFVMNKPYTLRVATEQDLAAVYITISERVVWLGDNSFDQWSTWQSRQETITTDIAGGRVDCSCINAKLHEYYKQRGWRYVRTEAPEHRMSENSSSTKVRVSP